MNIKSIINKWTVNTVVLIAFLNMVTMSVIAGPFDKGNTVATLAVGSGQYFREDYLIIGAGVGHYVADGIEVGIDVDYWSGGTPSIYEVTPKITFVYDNGLQLKPYLGLFYNRTYIDGLDDRDAYGYRAGVYMPAGQKIYLGFGVVYTELQSCTDTIFVNCSDTYTEVSFIITL